MPRKRRNKRDPLAQKLSFDEEHDDVDTAGNICESDRTSKNGAGQESVFPEVDGPPTASEQTGYAELIPTDFAHRGRLRLAAPSDNDGSPNRFLVTCVCVIFLILVMQWIKTEGYELFLVLYHNLWTIKNSYTDKESEDKSQLFSLSSLGFLWSFLVSFLLGLSCLFFSYGITYQDSLQPGQFPPSPVSPTKFRKQSGHTFHSSYMMALINGVGVFILSAWWLSS